MKQTARRVLSLALFLLLVAAIVVPAVIWRAELWKVFASVSRLREWVAGWGTAAPLVYVVLQAVQTIIFVIPGEVVQIAGGYLFGAWLGSALAIAGSVLGASFSFFLARFLGKPFVAGIVPRERMEGVERLLASRSARSIFFLLYLIPGIPKDVLGYVAGLSPLTYGFFITVSTLGRLPGLIGSAIIGGAAASSRWVLLGVVSGAAVLLFAAGLILRPKIQGWFERMAQRRKGAPEEPPAPPPGSPATGS
jgi:uncharacterized membrane protein YdjX (TVP38/TMEM64 family)